MVAIENVRSPVFLLFFCDRGITFNYLEGIRKAIYTTNAIESLNSVICKAIKKRKVFPTDDSDKQVVYLAVIDASKKWTMPIRNWELENVLKRIMYYR
jgi:transposase-like protein